MVFAIGSLSIVAATFQQPPAAGPEGFEVEKLKTTCSCLRAAAATRPCSSLRTRHRCGHEEPRVGSADLDKIKELTNNR